MSIDLGGYESIEEALHSWEDQIPSWAIDRTNGELVLGAQLPTRDGRKIGNAHIVETKTGVVSKITYYRVLTDAGNSIVFTEGEINDLFYPPKYIADVAEVEDKFTRQR